MRIPNRTKYNKRFRTRTRVTATQRGITLVYAPYGLCTSERGSLSSRCLEAARRVIARKTKRVSRLYTRLSLDHPMSGKPSEVRMGKGKGKTDRWVAQIRPGRVLMELGGTSEAVAKEAFRLAGDKLGVKTYFIKDPSIVAKNELLRAELQAKRTAKLLLKTKGKVKGKK